LRWVVGSGVNVPSPKTKKGGGIRRGVDNFGSVLTVVERKGVG